MKPIHVLTILCGLIALFYLNTALVGGEGGPGTELVFRPFHGVLPFYGGGEEGAWRRAHPGESEPWWLAGSYRRLAYFDDTGGPTPVMWTYIVGYYGTALSIVVLTAFNAVRVASRKRGIA